MRTKRTRQLYGAVIQCMPPWLARSLSIDCPNDGVRAMRRLRRDFDAVDPSDRTAAMSMIARSIISCTRWCVERVTYVTRVSTVMHR